MIRTATSVALAASCLLAATPAAADPCGMITTSIANADIERAGEQRTYVFYQDGVESIAIRPGFVGTIDEFGMLIPFPTAPAIRKLNDDVFAHLTAAIDPPEVVVERIAGQWGNQTSLPARAASEDTPPVLLEPGLHLRVGHADGQGVRVVREEAVGMYEVAVLEAGSTRALSGWMSTNGYRYPDGMEEAIRDYLDDGWVFVAVKARVNRASTPRPGMRDVDTAMPDGAEFAGHVQAMGFRFEVDAPVVPMRLSTFNGGDLHNVVYMLTDEPIRFNGIGRDLVVRQLTGEQLRENLTEPLPIEFVNIAPSTAYDRQRDPTPYNKVAQALFTADLAAASKGQVALGHEEHDKEMPRISAALRVSGTEDLEDQAIERERTADLGNALDLLSGMTMTVVDGEFPRDFLRYNNLTVAGYTMPSELNSKAVYDARIGRDASADAD